MTLQIRAIPDGNLTAAESFEIGTMTLQIRAIPRHLPPSFIQKAGYHDITNPGNPQTIDINSMLEIIKVP